MPASATSFRFALRKPQGSSDHSKVRDDFSAPSQHRSDVSAVSLRLRKQLPFLFLRRPHTCASFCTFKLLLLRGILQLRPSAPPPPPSRCTSLPRCAAHRAALGPPPSSEANTRHCCHTSLLRCSSSKWFRPRQPERNASKTGHRSPFQLPSEPLVSTSRSRLQPFPQAPPATCRFSDVFPQRQPKNPCAHEIATRTPKACSFRRPGSKRKTISMTQTPFKYTNLDL